VAGTSWWEELRIMPPVGGTRAGVFGGGVAIPDSEADQKLAHRWLLDDVNGTVEDSVGSANGTNNGVTSVDGAWAGGRAGDGGSGDNFIETTTLGDFGSNTSSDFAIALSFTTTDIGEFIGVINSGGKAEQAIGTTTRGFFGGSDDKLGFFVRDDGGSGNGMRVDSDQDVTNGNRYRAVLNKTGNNASDLEIWLNQSEENTTIAEDNFDPNAVVNFDEPVCLFANNIRGEVGNHINAVIDDVCVFNDSLTQEEIQSYQNPWE